MTEDRTRPRSTAATEPDGPAGQTGRQSPPGRSLRLARRALELGLFRRPGTDLAPYLRHLDELKANVAGYLAGLSPPLPPEARAEALSEVLARRYGYQGNPETYDELASACLMTTIDRRHGLPVALGILYLDVARAQGWSARGLTFPGHFLIRLGERAEGSPQGGTVRQSVILDPFHGGKVLPPPELRALIKGVQGPEAELSPAHFEDVPDTAILLRLQNNIKIRLEQTEKWLEAVDIARSMVELDPLNEVLWRDLALVSEKAGAVRAAIDAWQSLRAHAVHEEAREKALDEILRLRTRLN